MKTIAVGNTKGGAGKTTIATNLAVAAALEGQKVLLIDADVQASSMSFRALRENDLVRATAMTTPTLHKDIPAFSGSADLVIIDVGGRDSTVFRSAIAAADLLLIPVLPSVYDLWAAGDTMELLRDARGFNVETPARLVINQLIPNTIMGRETDDALSDYTKEAPLLKTRLHHRQVFKNAVAAGRGVIEADPKSKASQEIQALLDEVLALV